MAFLETPRFPDELAAWAVGGRGFQTSAVQTYGGQEFRNQNWALALGQWEIPEAQRITNPLSAYSYKLLRNFFLALRGGFNGFRFKDYTDYTDEGAGVLVAIDATHYQLYKNYVSGALTYSQIINKPISPVTFTGGSGISVDYTTGIITVTTAPSAWQGQFDIPVRFINDVPMNGVDSSGALMSWHSIKLVEVRTP
jgi:uncharacterized protein (TIGR02217 family)